MNNPETVKTNSPGATATQPASGAAAPTTSTDSVDPHLLLASYDELMKEFATEMEDLQKNGLNVDASVEKQHEDFLKSNWNPSFDNIVQKISEGWKQGKMKGAVAAAQFVFKHVAKHVRFKEVLQQKLLPTVKAVPVALVGKLKEAPAILKEWASVKDSRIWMRRAFRAVPVFLVLGGLIYFAANRKKFFPDETYEDLEARLETVDLVDLKDKKRSIDHLLTIPTMTAVLKEGKTYYRLVQLDFVIECDTYLTFAELNSESTLAEIKHQVTQLVGQLRYEDLNSLEEKERFRKTLIRAVQKLAPPRGKIYTVYFTKLVFAPMKSHR